MGNMKRHAMRDANTDHHPRCTYLRKYVGQIDHQLLSNSFPIRLGKEQVDQSFTKDTLVDNRVYAVVRQKEADKEEKQCESKGSNG